ncbi:uncharacterized protein LOC129761341 [Toxorhynchites rutilus septentrionalis]|uniref:uncharacterized protein LOC129761341 n=1 Tax=Toxorhynchites rutilus septentrionalis TaxID=329112 RepID=UPI00247A76A6|nr:uncharacterized protein LOC129761341 [Toxorhynchites rutilus septentrionalis]
MSCNIDNGICPAAAGLDATHLIHSSLTPDTTNMNNTCTTKDDRQECTAATTLVPSHPGVTGNNPRSMAPTNSIMLSSTTQRSQQRRNLTAPNDRPIVSQSVNTSGASASACSQKSNDSSYSTSNQCPTCPSVEPEQYPSAFGTIGQSRPATRSPSKSTTPSTATKHFESNENESGVSYQLLIYYQNVVGMNTSTADYYLACSDTLFDVFAFTETWLNDNTLSQQIFDSSYMVYRSDRSAENSKKVTGGGVLLAVRSNIKSREFFPPDGRTIEQVWAAVSLHNRTIFIGAVYIPPDRTNDSAVIDQHIVSLRWITQQMELSDNIVLLGDFNLPGIDWTQSASDYLYPVHSHSTLNRLSERLLDSVSTAGLCQKNDIFNNNNRILDLCFISSELAHNTVVIEASAPLVKLCRHHPPLLISISISPPLVFANTAESTYYNYRKADYSSMNRYFLGINWNDILENQDIDNATSSMSNVLLYAIEQFVPKKKAKKSLNPPWTNANLKRLKSLKRSYLRKFAKCRNDFWRSQYSFVNRTYKRLNKVLHADYLNGIQTNLRAHPSGFWKYVDKQRKEFGLPTVMTRNDTEASTSESSCELFRKQFRGVFFSECLDSDQVSATVQNVPSLSSVGACPTINRNVVQDACSRLKKSTNAGPDSIPSIVLKM